MYIPSWEEPLGTKVETGQGESARAFPGGSLPGFFFFCCPEVGCGRSSCAHSTDTRLKIKCLHFHLS